MVSGRTVRNMRFAGNVFASPMWLGILLAAASLAPFSGAGEAALDPFQGRPTQHFAPAGQFRLEHDNGRWCFVTPAGGAFLSFGVNHITWSGDRVQHGSRRPYNEAVTEKYGDIETWASAVTARLTGWQFNTAGGWSNDVFRTRLPHTPILSLSRGLWAHHWADGGVPDFFGAEFADYVEERAAKTVPSYAGDPMVLGYFIDNELPWAPDHNGTPELFDGYCAMPAGSPGKSRFVEFFRGRYAEPAQFNTVWAPAVEAWPDLNPLDKIKAVDKAKAKTDREDFTLLVARTFFKRTTQAIHKHDPGRLILGCRFIPQSVPRVVVQACGEYCDVVSVNFYETAWGGTVFFAIRASSIDRMPRDGDLSAYYEAGKKPVMVSEFSFRARDSGLPNTWPPGWAVQPVVETQRDRAKKYEHYVMQWFAEPWFVGAHWFEHADEPKEGRAGDGENGNYGLVTIEDEPYHEFVSAVTQVIPRAWEAHAQEKE